MSSRGSRRSHYLIPVMAVISVLALTAWLTRFARSSMFVSRGNPEQGPRDDMAMGFPPPPPKKSGAKKDAEPEFKGVGEYQEEYERAYAGVELARKRGTPTERDAALDAFSLARDNLALMLAEAPDPVLKRQRKKKAA